MIFEKIYHDGASVDMTREDLQLLSEVFNSAYTGLPHVAGTDPMKYAALLALGAAFQAAAVASEHMPESSEVTP